jgi:hypothetical protein
MADADAEGERQGLVYMAQSLQRELINQTDLRNNRDAS